MFDFDVVTGPTNPIRPAKPDAPPPPKQRTSPPPSAAVTARRDDQRAPERLTVDPAGAHP